MVTPAGICATPTVSAVLVSPPHAPGSVPRSRASVPSGNVSTPPAKGSRWPASGWSFPSAVSPYTVIGPSPGGRTTSAEKPLYARVLADRADEVGSLRRPDARCRAPCRPLARTSMRDRCMRRRIDSPASDVADDPWSLRVTGISTVEPETGELRKLGTLPHSHAGPVNHSPADTGGTISRGIGGRRAMRSFRSNSSSPCVCRTGVQPLSRYWLTSKSRTSLRMPSHLGKPVVVLSKMTTGGRLRRRSPTSSPWARGVIARPTFTNRLAGRRSSR